MPHITFPLDDYVLPVAICHLPQAKNISIRIAVTRDRITLTLPKRASVTSGLAFLESKKAWLLQHITPYTAFDFRDGAVISLWGEEYRILNKAGRGENSLENGVITIYGDASFLKRRLLAYLEKHFLAEAIKRSHFYAQQILKPIKAVRLKQAKSRWGSCSNQGILTYNPLLIFAPYPVFDYVIAHEVAHLQHMNHSPTFWKLVETLCPDMLLHRQWLKHNGHTLHCY